MVARDSFSDHMRDLAESDLNVYFETCAGHSCSAPATLGPCPACDIHFCSEACWAASMDHHNQSCTFLRHAGDLFLAADVSPLAVAELTPSLLTNFCNKSAVRVFRALGAMAHHVPPKNVPALWIGAAYNAMWFGGSVLCLAVEALQNLGQLNQAGMDTALPFNSAGTTLEAIHRHACPPNPKTHAMPLSFQRARSSAINVLLAMDPHWLTSTMLMLNSGDDGQFISGNRFRIFGNVANALGRPNGKGERALALIDRMLSLPGIVEHGWNCLYVMMERAFKQPTHRDAILATFLSKAVSRIADVRSTTRACANDSHFRFFVAVLPDLMRSPECTDERFDHLMRLFAQLPLASANAYAYADARTNVLNRIALALADAGDDAHLRRMGRALASPDGGAPAAMAGPLFHAVNMRRCALPGCDSIHTHKCMGCKLSRYCCHEHQASHWVDHRAQCRLSLSERVNATGVALPPF